MTRASADSQLRPSAHPAGRVAQPAGAGAGQDGVHRTAGSEALESASSSWSLLGGQVGPVGRDGEAPQALLLWLLRYPLLRAEDLAAVTGYSRQRTYVQLTQLEAAGTIEAVRVPALGLPGARLYHVSAVGMKLLADVYGDAIWRAAHHWGADESGLQRLLPRAPALVAVQTVVVALITGIGSALASPARAEHAGPQPVGVGAVRTEWAWERDYRFMLTGRATPDDASASSSSRSMRIDAYVLLRVYPSAGTTSLPGAVPATGRTDGETSFGLFVLNDGGFLDSGRPQATLRALLRGRQALEAEGGSMPTLLLLASDAHRAQRWQALNVRTAMERWLARPLDGGILVVPPPWQIGDRASHQPHTANERSSSRTEAQSLWQANWLSLRDFGSRRLVTLLTPARESTPPPLSTVPPTAAPMNDPHPSGPRRSPALIGHFNDRAAHWAACAPLCRTPGRSPTSGGGGNGRRPGPRSAPRSGHEQLAFLALRLDARHAAMLDLLAAHPLLGGEELAAVMNITSASAEVYVRRLRRLGLVMPATTLTLPAIPAVPSDLRPLHGRYALSPLGSQLLAARSGRSCRGTPRTDGRGLPRGETHVAAGDREVVALMRVPEHSAGVYQFVASLYRAAGAARAGGQAQRVVWWETGRACARQYRDVDGWHALRPDAAGEYQAGTQRLRFWLEWDRGTMGRRDLIAKFAAYAHYLRSREWRVDGNDPVPVLLIVTNDAAQETRLAAAFGLIISDAHDLTVSIALRAALAARGPLAPIWRRARYGAPPGRVVLDVPCPLIGVH